MSVLTRPMTADELDQMPDDGNRYELIGGELIVSPAPSPAHQRLVILLTRLLDDAVVAADQGEVFIAPIDLWLSPHDRVQPDLVYVAAGGRATVTERRIEGRPDLVVEILSPSNPSDDRVRKAALYARSEVPEYWIFDPIARAIEPFTLREGVYCPMNADQGVLRSEVLPTFVIDPVALWAAMDRAARRSQADRRCG